VAAARAAWSTESAEGIGGIAPDRLVFLDGCGVLTNMARLWGRSPRGSRAVGLVPCGHWKRLTVLGALGIGGMLATMSIEAATSGAVFLAYLDQVLLPELRRTKPDAVLVLDNLQAHKTAAVRRLLDRSGLPYRYLPAYSPDLNPIEPAWAKLKSELRRVAARTAEALHQALGPALDTITAQDAAGFFRHAGYSRPN
jgi:transposase